MNDKKIDWWGSLSNDVKDYLILKYGYDDTVFKRFKVCLSNV